MKEAPVPDKLLSCTIVICISVLIGKALAEDIPQYPDHTPIARAVQASSPKATAHRNFDDPSPVGDDSIRWAFVPVVATRHP